MKVLYILVSSTSDYYFEQALVSITSLRYVMPNASVSLLVDDRTDAGLVENRAKIKGLVDEFKAISFDDSVNAVDRSRSLKTRMRELVGGDFLYVDVDTVWSCPYDENDFTADVMAVADAHCLQKEHPLNYWIVETARKLNFYSKHDRHFNGGIFFMKDSAPAHDFAKQWFKLWKETCDKGIHIDQPSLNETNYRMNSIIKRLPDEYNVQIGRCLNYLDSAKIIHYFATWNTDETCESFYEFSKKSFLESIRKNGIDEESMAVICNPKKAFDKNTYILNYKMAKAIFSPDGNMLLNICQSEKSAEKRLRYILIKVAKTYYKVIPILYPIYRIFKK